MTAPSIIWLICRRCEKPFPTPDIRPVCPMCAYRQPAEITGEMSGV